MNVGCCFLQTLYIFILLINNILAVFKIIKGMGSTPGIRILYMVMCISETEANKVSQCIWTDFKWVDTITFFPKALVGCILGAAECKVSDDRDP